MSDDERARERAVILKRRAQLVAYAVAAGVATASCSGKTSTSACLSFIGTSGAGGTPVMTGGRGYCLSMPVSGTAGISTGGMVSVCLEPPIVGGSPEPGDGGAAAGEGGAGGEGGAAPGGSGGSFSGTPMICLTPPR